MEAQIEATQRECQTQLKEVKAGAERRRGKGTCTGAAKPLKFNGT
jgi:hypothetical protein